MPEIKRPVFFSGENPGMHLYLPGTEDLTLSASYWKSEFSPWGTGNALILWTTEKAGKDFVPFRKIYTDNVPLAKGLVEKLTQHFQEFRDIPLVSLSYSEAGFKRSFDGIEYSVRCFTDNLEIMLAWKDILDRKLLLWPDFQAGKKKYDLYTVIFPCRTSSISFNGVFPEGSAHTEKAGDGNTASSSFLAFSETWTGPVKNKEIPG